MSAVLGAVLFPPKAKARADMRLGVTYLVAGPEGSLFCGQVCADKSLAFFVVGEGSAETAIVGPVLSRMFVSTASIGRALRNGRWEKLGALPCLEELRAEVPLVQWPVGTLTVTVHQGGPLFDTCVEDTRIQDFEIMGVWDAEYHVPHRLLVDSDPEAAIAAFPTALWVGGPIWRERRIKELNAERYPEQPWHRLPAGWVPLSDAEQRD